MWRDITETNFSYYCYHYFEWVKCEISLSWRQKASLSLSSNREGSCCLPSKNYCICSECIGFLHCQSWSSLCMWFDWNLRIRSPVHTVSSNRLYYVKNNSSRYIQTWFQLCKDRIWANSISCPAVQHIGLTRVPYVYSCLFEGGALQSVYSRCRGPFNSHFNIII